MLVVCSKPVKEVLASLNTEGVGILREVTVLEHVVDVVPNGFELDLDQHVFSDTMLACIFQSHTGIPNLR